MSLAESKANSGNSENRRRLFHRGYETEEIAMESREERIEARARELREADGQADSKDRKYWTKAAQLIDEEDERIAKASVEEPSRLTQPGADRRGPWPTIDPVGVTLNADKRQN